MLFLLFAYYTINYPCKLIPLGSGSVQMARHNYASFGMPRTASALSGATRPPFEGQLLHALPTHQPSVKPPIERAPAPNLPSGGRGEAQSSRRQALYQETERIRGKRDGRGTQYLRRPFPPGATLTSSQHFTQNSSCKFPHKFENRFYTPIPRIFSSTLKSRKF